MHHIQERHRSRPTRRHQQVVVNEAEEKLRGHDQHPIIPALLFQRAAKEEIPTHTPPILPQIRHPPLLQIPIEERAQQRRQHRTLRDANGLFVVRVPDLDDVLRDVLFEELEDFFALVVGIGDLGKGC